MLLFSACSSPPADPNAVVFLIETMPANLDPRIGTDAQSQRLHSLIFSGLLQLDALLDQARVEMDREKRIAILADAQKIISGDLPYLTLWYLDNVCVHHQRVTGIQLTPSGDYDFLSGIVLR